MSKAASENCHDRAWQKHQREIQGFLEHRAGSVAEADDLLQEVFLKVLLQGRAFCELDNPRAWLFRVARNLIIDRRRLSMTREPLLPLPDDFSAPPAADVEPVDLLSHCLPSVLSRISAKDREAIVRCDLQGVTVSDYARQLGLSLPAAKSRLQRARLRLRSRLAKSCRVSYDGAGKLCCFVAASAADSSLKIG